MISIDNYTLKTTARNPMDPESIYKPLCEYELEADIQMISDDDQSKQMLLTIKNKSQKTFTGVIQLELCLASSKSMYAI